MVGCWVLGAWCVGAHLHSSAAGLTMVRCTVRCTVYCARRRVGAGALQQLAILGRRYTSPPALAVADAASV